MWVCIDINLLFHQVENLSKLVYKFDVDRHVWWSPSNASLLFSNIIWQISGSNIDLYIHWLSVVARAVWRAHATHALLCDARVKWHTVGRMSKGTTVLHVIFIHTTSIDFHLEENTIPSSWMNSSVNVGEGHMGNTKKGKREYPPFGSLTLLFNLLKIGQRMDTLYR